MFLSLGFAFIQNDQLTLMTQQRDDAKAVVESKNTEISDIRNQRSQDFQMLGFADSDGRNVSTEAIDRQVKEYINRFNLDAGTVKRIEDVASPVIAQYEAVIGERDALQTEINQLRSDLSSRKTAAATTQRERDMTIKNLRTEHEDMRNSKDNSIADLERQRDGLRDQMRELQGEITDVRDLLDQQSRDSAKALAHLTQRNDILSSRLNTVQRRSDSNDGSVLAVGAENAWIDLGFNQRIASGMEFEVRNASTNRVKGRIRVNEVEANKSRATILSFADKYDPIRANDVLVNAVYDPNRRLIVSLLGDGFGLYNKTDMIAKLSSIGIEVREGVSVETDFLLLGTAFFDEDSGEVMAWGSYPAHKAATSMSVEIVAQRDWGQWLGL
ncbi:MAG: hypothetical protein H8E25_07000 [Planctomycetes bacterium]|nr:hypothetical protein [Planctomycetota bacterium]